MKYHVAITPDGWHPAPAEQGGGERQIFVEDFGDGYRLWVELKRTAPTSASQIVQARLEQVVQPDEFLPRWGFIRRVRAQDIILHDTTLVASHRLPVGHPEDAA